MSKKSEQKAAVGKYKAAKKALDDNGREERRRGVTEETPKFQRLNAAVDDAMKDVPWWRR